MTKLHPTYVEFLNSLKEGPPLQQLPLAEARAGFEKRFRFPDERMEAVAEVEERTIEGPYGEIPLRIYWPESDEEKLPICLYFHGGGWVFGSLDAYEGPCRQIARRTPCILVAVDYRLAPEHPFPVAPEECYTATVWAAEHATELGGDPDQIAVVGGSVGGTMAATTALMARDRAGPNLAFQLLLYPVCSEIYREEDQARNKDQTMLTAASMHWYLDHYLSDPTQREDPNFLPSNAKDLRRLPPAFFVLAEHDLLTPGALTYLEALEAAGTTAAGRVYDHMIHSFLDLPPFVPEADAALEEALAHLRQAFD